MLYNKRRAGSDSTSLLTFLLNVNLVLRLSSLVPGFSPARPFLLPSPRALPASPASPTPVPTLPLPLLGDPSGSPQHP